MSGALGSLYALPAVLYTGAVPLGEVPAPAAEGGERGEAAACDSSAPKDGPHSSVPTEGGATCLTCGVGAHCTGSWAGFASSCQRDVSRPASPSLHNWSQLLCNSLRVFCAHSRMKTGRHQAPRTLLLLLLPGASGPGFASAAEQRGHFRSDWHRHNARRRAAGRPPLAEDEFERAAADGGELSSISGSDASSSEDEAGAAAARRRRAGAGVRACFTARGARASACPGASTCQWGALACISDHCRSRLCHKSPGSTACALPPPGSTRVCGPPSSRRLTHAPRPCAGSTLSAASSQSPAEVVDDQVVRMAAASATVLPPRGT